MITTATVVILYHRNSSHESTSDDGDYSDVLLTSLLSNFDVEWSPLYVMKTSTPTLQFTHHRHSTYLGERVGMKKGLGWRKGRSYDRMEIV